jgi:hypothetical protein
MGTVVKSNTTSTAVPAQHQVEWSLAEENLWFPSGN